MQNKDNYNIQNNGTTGGNISLVEVFNPLWHSRWMILFVTLSVIASSLAGWLYFAKYTSEGFFQFGGPIPMQMENITEDKAGEVKKEPASTGISLSDFKRFEASYLTSERLADFVREKKLESNEGIDDLSEIFEQSNKSIGLFAPVYPFTKMDAKELMDQPKDISNNIIALRINYKGRSPEQAQQIVGLLGRYVIDSIIYRIYADELQFKRGEMITKITKLENIIISKQEMLEKYRRKGADLKQIVSRYPESSRQTSGQVISVTEESSRYLSPITLMVTTEVQTSEANEAIHKAKREKRQIALWLEYYDSAAALMGGTKSGETILRGLESVKESVFKGKNLEDDVIKEVYNTITVNNQVAINLYLEKSRFIAGPTMPSKRSPAPQVLLSVSLILGLFLSILFVFARNWWHHNMLKVTGEV